MLLLELDAGLHAQLGVEVRERLIQQEGLRLADDGAAQGDALALAAGELARLALEQRPQLEDVCRLLDATVDLRLRRAAHPQAEGEIVEHGHVRVERVGLEDHGDVAVARGHVVDHLVADPDRAFAELLESGQHAQRRRLAAAGRTDHDHELRVLDVEVQVIDSDRATREALSDMLVGD